MKIKSVLFSLLAASLVSGAAFAQSLSSLNSATLSPAIRQKAKLPSALKNSQKKQPKDA
jgi:hypothetical protein